MKRYEIPVGVDSFAKIRENGYYYIDKTEFIKEILQTEANEVTLITRPRRFGKTLNMNMLETFFDIRKDSGKLFDGLAISEEKDLCAAWMNQWPVLFLTLKSVEGLGFEDAYTMLKAMISKLCITHYYLCDSEKIHVINKEIFQRLARKEASLKEVKNGLAILMDMMQTYYAKPVILLLDEYDVPLAKASEKGYYREMLDVLRGILGQALKGNAALKFAVITGCLKIAKESIFTGTNNFVSDTITGERFNEYFGFTGQEVQKILTDTQLEEHWDEMKQWYDGYRFGDLDIFCPWDVMNHVNALLRNPKAEPVSYWEHTSDNGIIRSFIERTELGINEKFEKLLAGGYVKQQIAENLTYDVLHSSEENLWSVLYLTGYLTQVSSADLTPGDILPEGQMALRIPNEEIIKIFRSSVVNWFQDYTLRMDRKEIFAAVWDADEQKVTEIFSNLLFDTISYHDYRESFYHAFLAGIFAGAGYIVESNYENGLGRSDVVVKDRKNRRVILFEAKHSDKRENMERDCDRALAQIKENQYAERFREDYRSVLCYGIAFYKKSCVVKADL